jgi:5-methylcytosine-specific restriction endonuclease McrA
VKGIKGCAAALLLALLFASDAEARDRSQYNAFRRDNPCPVTGKARGTCRSHEVDHIRPLCAGGADVSANMQWLSTEAHKEKTRGDLKTCAALRRAR